MTIEYNIRCVTPTDKDQILDLAKIIFNPKEQHGLAIQLSQYLQIYPEKTIGLHPETLIARGLMISQEWYLAKSIEGEVLGFTGLETHNYEGDYDIAWLNWTAIAPKYQGNGVGKGLLNHALDKVKEYGMHKFFVQTNPQYEIARKMYEKIGFQEIALLPDYSGDNNDVILYKFINEDVFKRK